VSEVIQFIKLLTATYNAQPDAVYSIHVQIWTDDFGQWRDLSSHIFTHRLEAESWGR